MGSVNAGRRLRSDIATVLDDSASELTARRI